MNRKESSTSVLRFTFNSLFLKLELLVHEERTFGKQEN